MNDRILSVLAVIDTKPKRRAVNRGGKGRPKMPRAYVDKMNYKQFCIFLKSWGI